MIMWTLWSITLTHHLLEYTLSNWGGTRGPKPSPARIRGVFCECLTLFYRKREQKSWRNCNRRSLIQNLQSKSYTKTSGPIVIEIEDATKKNESKRQNNLHFWNKILNENSVAKNLRSPRFNLGVTLLGVSILFGTLQALGSHQPPVLEAR